MKRSADVRESLARACTTMCGLSMFMNRLLLACLMSIALAVPMLAQADAGRFGGVVYAMTNAAAGNRVVVFDRARDGSLRPAGSFSTGGAGSGGGLGNQGALALGDSGYWLLAVNPGSHEISVFFAFHGHLFRTDVEDSGGLTPVSVTLEDDLVYVLNAGSDSVNGFRLSRFGRLTPIAGSQRALSGVGTGAAQVEFSKDGDLLVVTEKATNNILVFPVDADGLLEDAQIHPSPTPTPFGFAFGRRDRLFVSEAAGGAPGLSAMSSWQLEADGGATLITESAPTFQTAACWVVVTRSGRYAYTTNTGSDNLSGYAIDGGGELTLLDADGITAVTPPGSAPTDMALDRSSRHLYTLNPGGATISAFRVAGDGSLRLIEHQPSGLPAEATGLAAR